MAIFEPPDKPKPKPLVFGTPEPPKPAWQKAAPWVFIGACIIAILLMILLNPHQKSLSCQNASRMPGFAVFGTCSDD
jgi:hypothetical protein